MKTYGTLTHIPAGEPPHELAKAHWSIQATPDVTMRLKRLLPRAESSRAGAVKVYDTPEICRDLDWITQRWPLTLKPDHAKRLTDGADKHRHTEDAVLRVLEGRLDPIEGLMEPAIVPREYQRLAADLALTTGGLVLGDDLGLGKTFTSILALRDAAKLPAIVVCPMNLQKQWLAALGECLPLLRGHILRQGKPYDLTKVRALKGHEPDVLICSYGKLRGWSNHLAGKIRTVIFDEAHELRRADSDKYRAAGHVADEAHLRMGLTATPVFNYGGEVYNIFSIVCPGRLGGKTEFVREWGKPLTGGHIAIKDPAALGSWLRDQGMFLRRTRKDVGRELPPVVQVPHQVDTNEELYDELAADAAELARLITEGTKEERFLAGGTLDAKLRHATGVAKAPYVAAFVRMLLESEAKIVLFGWHHDVYDVWREQLADFNPVFYGGAQSASQKHQAKIDFTKGTSRVLVMSLRSGAGLEGLQEAAKVCVFGELDWSPAMHAQCVGRLNREGACGEVVAYYLLSPVGTDPLMSEVLELKRQQAEPIVDPNAAGLTPAVDTSGHVKRLAEQVLAKRSKPTKKETPMPSGPDKRVRKAADKLADMGVTVEFHPSIQRPDTDQARLSMAVGERLVTEMGAANQRKVDRELGEGT